jgi:hypothetical protein
MRIIEMGFEDLHWNQLILNADQRWSFENKVMVSRVI